MWQKGVKAQKSAPLPRSKRPVQPLSTAKKAVACEGPGPTVLVLPAQSGQVLSVQGWSVRAAWLARNRTVVGGS
ncbi:hypothetical protein GCM10010359_28870 [Streptomyces morookaense]|nr:hypothetical protein GCM10010359_28870 [Streptomyces morookaense]